MLWKRDGCNHCFWLGTYERPKCQALIAELKPDSVFYDVGANSGYYSLVAARFCSTVYAFEPMPRNIQRFKRNMRLNRLRNVTLFEVAVAARSAESRFRYGTNTEEGCLDDSGDIAVRSVALDELLPSITLPHIMKMDIEGGEFDALRGALTVLRKARPTIFLATHGAEVHRSCLDLLRAQGYRITPLQEDEIIARAS